jgi:hypothetical protein
MDLFTSIVEISDHHLVKLSCDMISGPGISISVGVPSISTVSCRVRTLIFKNNKAFIKAVPADDHRMAFLLVELALRLRLVGVEVPMTACKESDAR